MIHTATAMKVRQNLGELLSQVQLRHDSVLITKNDKPIAAIVDADLFEKIRLFKTAFDQMTNELAAAYSDISDEEAMKEIESVVKKIRKAGKK